MVHTKENLILLDTSERSDYIITRWLVYFKSINSDVLYIVLFSKLKFNSTRWSCFAWYNTKW